MFYLPLLLTPIICVAILSIIVYSSIFIGNKLLIPAAIFMAVMLYVLPYIVLRMTDYSYYYWSQGSGEIEITIESELIVTVYFYAYFGVSIAECKVRDYFYEPQGG